jgi:hypothetical protein
MEYFSAVTVIVLILLIIVMPAIWSSDAVRRADAREILRMILAAFGRRQI